MLRPHGCKSSAGSLQGDFEIPLVVSRGVYLSPGEKKMATAAVYVKFAGINGRSGGGAGGWVLGGGANHGSSGDQFQS